MGILLLSSPQRAYFFFWLVFSVFGLNELLLAEEAFQRASSSKTRIIVADLLMVDGDLYIVRGERGEIQIEVTPETKLSEKFTFGDRIKAIVLPNDVAQSITRAAQDEPVGMTSNEPTKSVPPSAPTTKENQTSETPSTAEKAPTYETPKVRVIIANILMVDGSFYIVRSEYGEIQIEITPKTELNENFKFGDKIKARVTPNDKALSVVRASADEPTGIHEETTMAKLTPSVKTTQASSTTSETSEPLEPEKPSTRIIVADVLMLDGDLYVLRGDRGEIRIEVTSKTKVSEPFDYGDRVKAEVLPNDKALTIERADPNDPIGITTP